MGARIINLADYRRRKQKPKPASSVAAVPMMVPMVCAYGWFMMPVMMPMMVSSEFHA